MEIRIQLLREHDRTAAERTRCGRGRLLRHDLGTAGRTPVDQKVFGIPGRIIRGILGRIISLSGSLFSLRILLLFQFLRQLLFLLFEKIRFILRTAVRADDLLRRGRPFHASSA